MAGMLAHDGATIAEKKWHFKGAAANSPPAQDVNEGLLP